MPSAVVSVEPLASFWETAVVVLSPDDTVSVAALLASDAGDSFPPQDAKLTVSSAASNADTKRTVIFISEFLLYIVNVHKM